MRRRKLGQHYLVDERVVLSMVEEARILPNERVLEIGTGRGALTKELVGLTRSFEGYEVDPANYERTLSLVGNNAGRIHLGDAFEHKPAFDVLVASLPYSQSLRFVEWLAGLKFRRAVVLLQEDFVRKVLAEPGSRNYRGVSALSQVAFGIEVLSRIGRASFSPPPKVSSLLVSITPKTRLTVSQIRRLNRLFSLRRKQVTTALALLKMADRGYDFEGRRVYSLTPGEVARLCFTDRAVGGDSP